jgi:putative addiction module component (TIGR02574 family)
VGRTLLSANVRITTNAAASFLARSLRKEWEAAPRFVVEQPKANTFAPKEYNLCMTQEAQELLRKALALPDKERAELAGNLISSLDATVDPDADAAWQQEVVRRLHDVQSGRVETISWEKVQQKGRTLLHGE